MESLEEPVAHMHKDNRTVFKNGKVIAKPSKDDDTTSECIIVKNDLIEYVGFPSNEQVISAEESGAKVIDLEGRTVLPGFIDGHVHLLMFGESLKKLNLRDCQSLVEIQTRIREYAKAQPDLPRILCRGWIQATTDNKALASTIDGLDEKNRPVYIDSNDLHSVWCNTPALKELDVQNTPDPPGGEVHRDQIGMPDGLMSESACFNIVWPYLAKAATHEQKLEFLDVAIKTYNAAGYTGIVEMAMDENQFQALLDLRNIEPIPIRIAMHWLITPSDNDEDSLKQVDRASELHKQYNLETSPNFRIAGIKLICDGVVDACTASLTEPYSSNGIICDPIWPADKLKKVVHKADAAGLQCALHAIGESTVKLAVDTLESLDTKDKRHRIEHLELTRPEDARRLGELGITASVQAVHSDPSILKAWPTLIGHERLRRAFAYREFHDHGANVALGTDSPTAPHDPFPNLYTMVTRRSALEPELKDMLNPEFALPLMHALAAATYGSAYSCFADKTVGSLDVGKKADFFIADFAGALDQPENLLRAYVHETWFEGKRVFPRG